MDIQTQVEIDLREAGYDTWLWNTSPASVVCFENQSLVGFVHVFPTAEMLLHSWREAQQFSLARYAAVLRPAGAKAWNVYSIFLTAGMCSATQAFQIERIEEDFALTRKIARCNVGIGADVANAILPLLPIKLSVPVTATDFVAQLRNRLRDVQPELANAFLERTSVAEVAKLLVELS